MFVQPNYRNTKDEIQAITNELNLKIDSIVSQASSINSDFGKEKFFHDYICKNTVYDLSTYENNGDSIYSVFVNGRAICEGYARAMKLLLDKSNIYNYLIIGETKNQEGNWFGHMWNVVSIENELYHLDVTWDDKDGSCGQVNYLYFNVTDEEIRKDHFKIEPYENNCTAKTYNYFNVNGTYFISFNNFNGMVSACSSKISDDLLLEMKFANKTDYENLKIKVKNNDGFFDFINSVVKLSGTGVRKDQVNYVFDDEHNYLCIIFLKG